MQPHSAVSSVSRWYALRTDRPLHHQLAACQALRLRSGCEACATACPVGAIQFAPQLNLHDDCLGCGQCVPACPMGALGTSGLPAQLPEADEVLRVDCRRVPPEQRATVSVTCLGALDVADLLNWQQQFPVGVELLDRGWCHDCPVGGGDVHPAESVITQTRNLLDHYQIPAEQQPRLRLVVLPAAQAQPLSQTPLSERGLSRRAFFRRVVVSAPDLLRDPHTPKPALALGTAVTAQPSLARQRLLVSIGKLARSRQAGLPAPLFPSLRVSDACRNHQGCIRVCPTGALQPYENADASGNRFLTTACISCGLCLQHCPEQALQWQTPASESPQPLTFPAWEGVTLTRHTARQCQHCGSGYSLAAGETDPGVCDPCNKSRELARGAFQQLFGARA